MESKSSRVNRFRMRTRQRFLLFFAFIAAVGICLPLAAQDTRQVTEPRYPPACAVLRAVLSAPHGQLAEADEQRLDTVRLQHAIDACSPGHAVELRSARGRHVFLSGPLALRSGVTLRVDAHAVLYASRDPRLYDLSPGSCGVVNARGHGCKPFLLADHAPGSGIVGDGVIDGRGGETLLGQNVTWWDLAHEAKVTDRAQSCFRLVEARHSDNFVLYRITLRNSPNFHVLVSQSDGFTAWGVKIDTPATARNTDGIDPASSTNVSILYSSIRTGDDDVAIKAGSTGPSRNITLAHDHFYSGHGMSIGSETNGGVSAVRVSDLTIDGADNGIRIKSDRSRGGLVRDVNYDGVCMRDVKNPIMLTPLYTTHPGDLLPEYRDIALRNVHILTAGRFTFDGIDAAHRLGVTLDNVFADGVTAAEIHAAHADLDAGPALGNLLPSGDDVTLTRLPGSAPGSPLACTGHFPPFPENAVPNSAENVPAADKSLYVAADGTGEFTSVQQAVDAAPADGATIRIAPGVYRETVLVDKPNIRLVGNGDDPSATVIVFDKSAGTSGGTLHSATATVHGDNFLAENLTFQNDWNATHPQLPAGSQALALLVTGDHAVFRSVRLLGNQDTVYAGSRNCSPDGQPCIAAHQYFSHCTIAGNVDFIFGDGKTVFDDCAIHSTLHKGGFITAQAKHYAGEDSGFLFLHCRLTADAGVSGVFLGRPWRPYASVVFIDTEMGSHIDPAGWREWHPGETHSLETVDYEEFGSTGPGAHPESRDPHAKLLTAAEAARHSVTGFLDGWNPAATPELAPILRSDH